MKTRGLFFCFICILLLSSINAQDFSDKFNKDYPLFGYKIFGFKTAPKVSKFANIDYFNSVTNENGKIETVLEDESIKKGIKSLTLLISINDTKVCRMLISFQSDEFSEQNYLTYLKYIDFINAQSQEIKYDGYTQESLGEIMGFFSAMMDVFYIKDKLLNQ